MMIQQQQQPPIGFQRCRDEKSMGEILRRRKQLELQHLEQLKQQLSEKEVPPKAAKTGGRSKGISSTTSSSHGAANAATKTQEPSDVEVFGAPDVLGASPRQVCGAAVAGGMAAATGAFLSMGTGVVVGAVAGAASAALCAARAESEIGEAARSTGDALLNTSQQLILLPLPAQKQLAVERTIAGAADAAQQHLAMQAIQTKEHCTKRANQLKDGASIVRKRAGFVKDSIGRRLTTNRANNGAAVAADSRNGSDDDDDDGATDEHDNNDNNSGQDAGGSEKRDANTSVATTSTDSGDSDGAGANRDGSGVTTTTTTKMGVRKRASLVLTRRILRRGNQTDGNDSDDELFHDCIDDTLLDEEDGEFEDARVDELKEIPRSVKEVIGLLPWIEEPTPSKRTSFSILSFPRWILSMIFWRKAR